QLGLIDRLDAKRARLFELASRLLSNDNEIRRFGHAARDAAALRLNQFRCLAARKRRQRSGDDDRQALEGTPGRDLLRLREVHAGGRELPYELANRWVGEVCGDRDRDRFTNAA